MIQVVAQTDEQIIEMYMKLKKKKLAEMLMEANKHIERLTKPLEIITVGTNQKH